MQVVHGSSSPRGVPYKQKYVPAIGKGGDGAGHHFNCTPPPRIVGYLVLLNYLNLSMAPVITTRRVFCSLCPLDGDASALYRFTIESG